MPKPTPILDYAERYPGYIRHQYYRAPVLQAILESWLQQVQSREDTLRVLLDQNALSDMQLSFLLDIEGELIGESRNGRDNAAYRTALLARRLINRSQGRAQDYIFLLQTLYQDADVTLEFRFSPYDELGLIVAQPVGFLDPVAVNDQIQTIAPAAAMVHYIWYPAASDDTFAFAPGSVVVSGDNRQGFSDLVGASSGRLVGVLGSTDQVDRPWWQVI